MLALKILKFGKRRIESGRLNERRKKTYSKRLFVPTLFQRFFLLSVLYRNIYFRSLLIIKFLFSFATTTTYPHYPFSTLIVTEEIIYIRPSTQKGNIFCVQNKCKKVFTMSSYFKRIIIVYI